MCYSLSLSLTLFQCPDPLLRQLLDLCICAGLKAFHIAFTSISLPNQTNVTEHLRGPGPCGTKMSWTWRTTSSVAVSPESVQLLIIVTSFSTVKIGCHVAITAWESGSYLFHCHPIFYLLNNL